MPRLRSELTGAVMTVDESVAAQLGGEWVAADKADEKPAPRRANGVKSEASK